MMPLSLPLGFGSTPQIGGVQPITLEVCIDNIQSGLAAEAAGASRIELCSALSEGGLTPSVGFLKIAKSVLNIPIYAMIRPRGGDFCYSAEEVRIMEEDIVSLKENGADGLVFGVLTPSNEINIEICTKLLKLAYPLPTTFHRAFDHVADQFKSLDLLIGMGFQRILTSGQASTAEKGAERISKLITESRGNITIMAGAGVTAQNIRKIVEKSEFKITEVHGSFRTVKKAKKLSIPGISAITMGSVKEELNLLVTDKEIVRKVVGILGDLQLQQSSPTSKGKDKNKDKYHRKMEIGSPTNVQHVYHYGNGPRFYLDIKPLAGAGGSVAAGANFTNLNRTQSAPSTPTKPGNYADDAVADASATDSSGTASPFAKPRRATITDNSAKESSLSPIVSMKPIPLPRTISLNMEKRNGDGLVRCDSSDGGGYSPTEPAQAQAK